MSSFNLDGVKYKWNQYFNKSESSNNVEDTDIVSENKKEDEEENKKEEGYYKNEVSKFIIRTLRIKSVEDLPTPMGFR